MESKFIGRFWPYFGRSLLASFLSGITLGIAAPWCFCWLYKWHKEHTLVDGYKQTFDGKGIQLWGKILLWLLLTVITLGIYSFYLPIAWSKWIAKHTHFAR